MIRSIDFTAHSMPMITNSAKFMIYFFIEFIYF